MKRKIESLGILGAHGGRFSPGFTRAQIDAPASKKPYDPAIFMRSISTEAMVFPPNV